MHKYVVLELIPTHTDPKLGEVIQLSALKIDNLKLVDRFDYRLNEEKILINELIKLISYDKDSFTYLDSTNDILEEFQNFVDDYKIVYIDNTYTYNYISYLKGDKVSINSLLNISKKDDVVEEIMKRYNIEPSNYIVDILYEGLIYKSNEVA
ncbi:MAG: hypothetical protein PHQ64_01010 [Bacilli bacterium]|nr:hypothetical protein [Bacilli bacterium]